MFYARYLIVAVLVCIVFVSDLHGKRMPIEEDLTVLINYEQYQERIQPQRVRRHVLQAIANHTQPFLPYAFPNQQSQKLQQSHIQNSRFNECDADDECEIKVCSDPINEVYQECGSKCVLGCRYASTSSGISISKYDCEKNECVEGCFCKTGLIRHQSKCIPASECPVRKCNHRYEVYMCGPAAPITCDNALRQHEIIELTKRVECVWGCFCAQGYLRNNYNGKCVPEQDCRNTKSIDILPQIPGLFKHLTGCGPYGCGGSNHHHRDETRCGSKGCTNESGHEHHSSSSESDSNTKLDSKEDDNDQTKNDRYTHGSSKDSSHGSNHVPSHDSPPAAGWTGFPGQVIHYHQWNDTTKLTVPVELTGATINGTCIGTYACTGEYSGNNNHGPGSVSSGTPLTTVTLANGTTITTPIGSGSAIDVETELINTGATLGDDDEQYDEMNKKQDDETSVDKDEKPSTPQVYVPVIKPVAIKPSASQAHTPMATKPQIPSNEMKESSTTVAPPKEYENSKPQPSTGKPSQFPVSAANNHGSKPQVPVAVASPLKPSNGNSKPNSHKPNEAKPTYSSSGNGINFGQRPQFVLPPYVPNGNNYFGNQQTPNNGIQNPFINPFIQLGSFPISPNFGYNPNTVSNGAHNSGPNIAPNVQPFASPYFAQSQFLPPNFYSRPLIPPQNVPNKDKIENEESSSEEDKDASSFEDDESISSEEVNSFESSQQQNTQHIPPKKPLKVPQNSGASGNKVPPNYEAYFNFLNQFNQNQGNPNQVNPNHVNRYQYNPSQLNPNQGNHGGHPSQFNPYQFHQQQFNPNQFNPNQINTQPIPNQYYPNNFNAPPSSGYFPQFTSPNTQHSQNNPYNNPFYTQSATAFLNQINPNIGTFSKSGNSNPTPNRKVISKPSRKHQIASEQKPTSQVYTNNRKIRPNSDRNEAEIIVKPEIKPQITANEQINSSEENIEQSEDVFVP